MKGILGLLKMTSRGDKPAEEHTDSVLFSTAFAGQGVDDSMLVPSEARAVEARLEGLLAGEAGKAGEAASAPEPRSWWPTTPPRPWPLGPKLRA